MIKAISKLALTTLFALLLTTVFTSCEHKPLEYPVVQGKLKVRIDVDWSLFDGDLPSGMTVAIYPALGSAPVSITTNDISHVTTSLAPGEYHIGVINYSLTEFGTLDFEEVLDKNSIGITTKSTTSSWYTPLEGETLALEPEPFAVDVMFSVIVPDENEYESVEYETRNDEVLIATLRPVNIIYTVDVNLRIQGIKNLKSAAGALTNLASRVNLSTMTTGDSKVTHLLESWSLAADYASTDTGTLAATISCFGLPSDNTQSPEDNILKLSILLVDNKTILSYTIPVGDLCTKISERHLSFDYNDVILLPETQSASSSTGSAGFDVNVDDWIDENDVDIII